MMDVTAIYHVRCPTMNNKDLDKYYTKPEIVRQCFSLFQPYVEPTALYIEPSAGSGAFLDVVSETNVIFGYDLVPEHPDIIQQDYLTASYEDLVPEGNYSDVVCIGNPPFGKKSKLAIDFLNQSLNYFGVVGFILPVQFRKWSAQKHIDTSAKLVLDETLPEDSFLLDGKNYNVRCCFQIWTTKHPDLIDLRMDGKPAITHDDFDMWQFNRTTEAEKYFDYDWDFAVVRQGFYDYSFKAFTKDECDRKRQWIFFKAKSPEALSKLMSMDFKALSEKNTGTPGFGKADVVSEYIKL